MANTTQFEIGSVVSLWRYPVKSMMGEELNATEVTERGVKAIGIRRSCPKTPLNKKVRRTFSTNFPAFCQWKCVAPGLFGQKLSAGGHYNPSGNLHGLDNPSGPHNGDLPNLIVNEAGIGRLNATTDRVTLSPGAATLFDADGSALVVHAGPDDNVSNPAGNSGARIACGVIEAG